MPLLLVPQSDAGGAVDDGYIASMALQPDQLQAWVQPDEDYWSEDLHATPIEIPAVLIPPPDAFDLSIATQAVIDEAYQQDSGQLEDYWGNVYGFPDQVLDAVPAAQNPPDVTEPFFAQYPLAEQPWFPDEETQDYANDSALEVHPQLFPPDVTEPFFAQYPLAEQPWYPDQDTEDYAADSTLDVTPQLFPPTAQDDSYIASTALQADQQFDPEPEFDWTQSAEQNEEVIAQPIFWVDFSNTATLFTDTARTTPVSADGDPIRGVTDLSPSGFHLSQATTFPTYKTGIYNGLSVSRWDGTAKQLNSASGLSVAQPITRFVVARLSTAAGDRIAVGAATFDSIGPWRSSGNWGIWGGSSSSFDGAADLSLHVFTYVFNGTTSNVWLDGTQIITNVSVGSAGVTQYEIGSYAGGTQPWQGDICEIIDFRGALPTSDRQSYENYLTQKWGPRPFPEVQFIPDTQNPDDYLDTFDYYNNPYDGTEEALIAGPPTGVDDGYIAAQDLPDQTDFTEPDWDEEPLPEQLEGFLSPNDAFDTTIATQPLAEQPWFEAQDIDTELDNDSTLDITGAFFQPDVTDDFQAAQPDPSIGQDIAAQFPEDFSQHDQPYVEQNEGFIAGPPTFAPDAEAIAAQGEFQAWVWSEDVPDIELANDTALDVSPLTTPPDSVDLTTAATWFLPEHPEPEPDFIPDAAVDQAEVLSVTVAADDSYIATLDLPQYPFDEDPWFDFIALEDEAVQAFLLGDDGVYAAQDLPDQWADALDETPEQPQTPLDVDWLQGVPASIDVLAAQYPLAEQPWFPDQETEDYSNGAATLDLSPFFAPVPPPSGTGPDFFTAVIRSRWNVVLSLRWVAVSKQRWTNHGRSRWTATGRSRFS